ncbi:uncharacterized protein LOC129371933 [Poeciliopsis prolifica]|uniref:uncharacterized protein LOC129362787 n=1 Tax=Poeciliopsis prolifica TaxID=188132 RepID=UPI0024139C30|nr:uncharacterized protein LOC129362787 [Poeciliopsis prolifica]XP_054895667.1 uncharacterized protein LOC129366087 [Poeciliopsis prolifica]XP_054904792.1 uncharacterized protein LOC129371933 [Poeciliopsis prolifica]
MDIDNIIEQYFRSGFTNLEILGVLEETHNVKLSLRTLERRLQKKRLWRRKNKTDVAEVASFIEHQLQGSGRQHGYRWMHQKCWMAGIVTDRETVRLLMRLLDPNRVDLRAQNRLRRRLYVSRGPNYVWHIDGYDKLKPYGICINGCIDGFSRKMIWLEAYKTNSDPHIIAGYFIDAVMEYNGFPQKIRMDHGTENTYVAAMQRFLHNTENENGFDSVILGPSTGNQRIERWWCTLRSECTQFWMEHFDQLKADGYFVDSFLDKSLIQFCFLQTIQMELDEVVHTWNDHRIRSTNNPRAPPGRPTLMHGVPNLYGVPNFLQSANLTKLEICVEECHFKDFPCDVDVFHLCTELMTEHRLVMTDDVYEITNLYVRLRQMISDGLRE